MRPRGEPSAHGPSVELLIKTLARVGTDGLFFEETVSDLLEQYRQEGQCLDDPIVEVVLNDCAGLNNEKKSRIEDILQQQKDFEIASIFSSKQRTPPQLARFILSIIDTYTLAHGHVAGKEVVKCVKLEIFGPQKNAPKDEMLPSTPASPCKHSNAAVADAYRGIPRAPLQMRKEMDKQYISQKSPEAGTTTARPEGGHALPCSPNHHHGSAKDGHKGESGGNQATRNSDPSGQSQNQNSQGDMTCAFWSVQLMKSMKSPHMP